MRAHEPAILYVFSHQLFNYDFRSPGSFCTTSRSKILLMKLCQVSYDLEKWLILREVDAQKQVYERMGLIRVSIRYPSEQELGLYRLYKSCAEKMVVTIS